MKRFLHMFLYIAILILPELAMASDRFPVEGRLVNPDGSPVESAAITFKLQVYDPGESCLLFEEDHTANLTGTDGYFSLALGTGSLVSSANSNAATLSQVMDNSSGSMTCVNAGSFDPLGNPHSRKLKISYDDGGGLVAMSGFVELGGVPYANFAYNANSVGGITPGNILQHNTSTAFLDQASLENVFASATDDDELRNLIDGTSAQYMVSTPTGPVAFNSQQITGVATPSGNDHAVNMQYADGNMGGKNVDTTAVSAGSGDGMVLTWNQSLNKWEAQSAAAGGDINNGGNSTGATIVLGTNDNYNMELETNGTTAITIDNAQGVSLAQGLGVTAGINTGGNVSLLAQSELRLEDAAGGESVALKAPATVTPYTMELPAAAGAINQILKLDGTGNLIWANDDNSGTVTTVFGRTGAVVAAASDYTAAQVDNVAAGSIAATDVQGAIDELDSEKVSKAGDSLTGNLHLGTQSELRLEDDVGGEYVGLRAPAGVTSYTMNLPASVGSMGQVLELDGGGNLVWGTVNSNVVKLGGQADAANISVGTNDAFEFKLRTNALDRMSIASNGDFNFHGNKLNDVADIHGKLAQDFILTNDIDIIIHADDDGNASGNIRFETGNAPVERMRINNNGKVGIGTIAPAADLDVKGKGALCGSWVPNLSERWLLRW